MEASSFYIVIRDVYPTTNWEDTAISAIEFYLDGVEIDIDYSKYAGFLEVSP